MRVARSWGIPLSVMRGRSLAEETTYTYDENHRVVSTRTIRQPEWLREDWLLARGLDAYERSLCGDCGHPRDRAWHPDMDGWYEAEEIQCNACAAMAQKARETADSGRTPSGGRKFHAVDTRPPGQPLHPVEL